MAKLIERDGKTYCVEGDCEWEYVPSEPSTEFHTPTTTERISDLEAQTADFNLQIIDLFEQLLDKGVL